MADYKVTDTSLTSIANAIRLKGGTESQLVFPTGFVSAIQAIQGNEVYIPSGISGNIITGAENPTASQGINGDTYFKLLDHDNEYATVSEVYIKQSGVWVSLGTAHVPYSGLDIVPFSSGTDKQIEDILVAANLGLIDLKKNVGWSIGDTRTIHLTDFTVPEVGKTVPAQDIDIVITSFDEYMSCGNVLQFDFKDCLSVTFALNNTRPYDGRFDSTFMYTDIIPKIVDSLPAWLQRRLITFDVISRDRGASQNVVVQNNKLALRSVAELWLNGEIGEGTYIPYYDNNTLPKKIGHNGNFGNWRTRTPSDNQNAYCVTPSASKGAYYITYEAGIAPFGCL